MELAMPALSPRLMAAASLVEPGRTVADIGTDHALLPAYLVAKGICPRAVAADLRAGPLTRAKRTVERFGLSGRIRLVLSDGLNGIAPGDVEELVFCGMGGELMAELLSRAHWIRDGGHAVVLQPMSGIAGLRRWLFENGFAVRREKLAAEGRHLYYAMRAAPGQAGGYEPYELVFGRGLAKDAVGLEYLGRLVRRYRHIADKAGNSAREGDRERAEEAKSILRGLYLLRGEWGDTDAG